MTTDTDARSAAAERPENTVAVLGGANVSPLLPRVSVACLAFIALFTACWVGAFHDPVPHGVQIGVVGTAPLPAESAVAIHRYGDASALRQAVEHATVAGGIVLEHGQATIWTAQAQGRQTVQFVTTYLTGVAARSGDRATVHALAPFASGDSAGVVPFFVVLSLLVPSLIAGALIGSASALRRSVGVAALVGFSILAYLLDWLIADRWLGAITGSSSGYAGVVVLYVLAVSATAAGLAAWGRPLVAIAGALFLGLAVPATGGPAALGYFLPAFFQHLQLLLPPSAAVYGIRADEWFDGVGVPTACLTLGAWSVAGTVALLAKRRTARPSTKG
jgi:hypothetical protein